MAFSVIMGVRLWNVTSSMPRWRPKSVKRPMRGSPIVPVPTMWTIFFIAISCERGRWMRSRRPEGYDESRDSPTAKRRTRDKWPAGFDR